MIEVMRALAVGAGLIALAASASAQDAAGGDPNAGEEVFKKCRACHDVGPNAKNKVGPILTGIVGRPAGTIPGFSYSEANKSAGAKGLVWTEDVMFQYLEDPRKFMPNTKMAFVGLKDPKDRKDVIAYLKQFGPAPKQ